MDANYPRLALWYAENAKSSEGMAVVIFIAALMVASVWLIGRNSERRAALATWGWGAGLWCFGALLMVMGG